VIVSRLASKRGADRHGRRGSRISRGAFYSNFESKDDLFLELISHHLDAEIETLRHALDRIKSAQDFGPGDRASLSMLGQDDSWCLLSSEFQLYTMRGGIKADQFGELYEAYRRRLG
jgi:AcrR family transcriptional regulator